ncbi:MAG: cytochrome b562 [bacterium]
MKKAYKELSLRLEKPQESGQGAYVALAESIKASAIQAREFVPKLAAKLPPDQKAAMVKSFQADMDQLVASVDGLIRNLKESKWDEARKDIANLKNEMRDGHREFRKD